MGMRYITERWQSINKETGEITLHPYYLAKDIWGGRVIGKNVLVSRKIPSSLGRAYWRYELCAGVFYPKPLHLIVRCLHWLNYWSYLPTGHKIW